MAIVNDSASPRNARAALHRTYRIADGLTAEFSYFPGEPLAVQCVWTPDGPPALRGQALRRYRRVREEFLMDVRRRIGTPLLVLDLPHWPPEKLRDLALAISKPRGHA